MNEKAKPKKSRADGEQSRERLLLASMRLFAEQGYSRASTREIALAAGVNVAAISYYFGDKAGLYKAAFTAISPAPADNIAMFDQPHFTLRESLEGFFKQMLAPLLEEWIMRAGVHHYLLQRCSPAAALCLSSVLFAALHGNAGWQQVVLVFWPGLLFGAAYQRWRDWRLCALLHGLSN
eukprot:gene3349-3954_t